MQRILSKFAARSYGATSAWAVSSCHTHRSSEGPDIVIEEKEAPDSALLSQRYSSVSGRLELAPLYGRAAVLKGPVLYWNARHHALRTLSLTGQASGLVTRRTSRCTLRICTVATHLHTSQAPQRLVSAHCTASLLRTMNIHIARILVHIFIRTISSFKYEFTL